MSLVQPVLYFPYSWIVFGAFDFGFCDEDQIYLWWWGRFASGRGAGRHGARPTKIDATIVMVFGMLPIITLCNRADQSIRMGWPGPWRCAPEGGCPPCQLETKGTVKDGLKTNILMFFCLEVILKWSKPRWANVSHNDQIKPNQTTKLTKSNTNSKPNDYQLKTSVNGHCEISFGASRVYLDWWKRWRWPRPGRSCSKQAPADVARISQGQGTESCPHSK